MSKKSSQDDIYLDLTEKDNNFELIPVKTDKQTRFEVNRVNNEEENEEIELRVKINSSNDDEDDVHSCTDRTKLNSDYIKSFRQLTREALPRLDNYRNIMSVQATNRPTLDELRDATLTNKINQRTSTTNGKLVESKGQFKFGWIQGVFIRCLLNIWGVILFLRLTWVVGQAGIGQSILLILTTTVVTSITSLSMSAICTNGDIKGGGTYYMISRSLGPEFGGSIGLIFSLANAVACAMYVVGFCESLQDLLDVYQMKVVDGGINDIRIIGSITIIILTTIVVFGMEWEAKAQFALLVVLIIALLDYFIGSIIGPQSLESKAKGFLGFNATLGYNNLFSDYRWSEGMSQNFFSVFAIFFPAATGILAGANISGDLKDPQSSIPKGTLLAILVTSSTYILMSIVAGCTVLRDASGNITDYVNGSWPVCLPGNCTYGLQNDFQVVELVSWVGPIIYAGCFAAALSSALASLVSAPKVFQALCKDKLYPGIHWFAKGYGINNEPYRGYVLTLIIAVGFILIGELNLIAPLISNFFLAAYTLINFSTFHASLAKPIGWRPKFKYYNMWLSLLGSIMCLLVMFLISWITALLTFTVVLTLYLLVAYRKPDVNWGSTTQAQMYKNALQGVYQLNTVEEHVKNYRPQILVMSGMPSARPALVDFAHLLTKNLSMLVCGHINTTSLQQRVRNVLNYKANSWLRAHKLKAFYMQIDGLSFEEGCNALLKACGIGKLKPNILLLGFKNDWQTCSDEDRCQYFNILHSAFDLHMGVGIIRIQQGFNPNIFYEEEAKSVCNLQGNKSYSQISQASTSSGEKSIKTNKEIVSETPNPDKSTKKAKSVEESVEEQEGVKKTLSTGLYFKKQQRKGGTIDVWWLYDDGGLTLLLPYIINTRKSWRDCKLRVFALANKRNELEIEHRNMASLLAKFRIDYADLQIISDITTKPQESTKNFFESIIADFRCSKNDTEQPGCISDSELLAVEDKTNRHLRLRELLLKHSNSANIVVVTLPIPRKNIISAPLYLAWIEILTKDMPPILLVRGNQTSVLTFYS
ncbi:bumetanide-sensitive sodium-(potassium)-chloride cotransporter isoform X1 [Diorhabda carinulata]|uniref:bumetanide-sensitive sodium-(potassium)-chloride cotransporter isoform X1 n=2 Tax=Diorhabda carinulata TaxID=1163345 RepID=UPI0025A22113|nr:bumetanide-sensitive sodium-(potassium)-chloride cotransporter isoform X1 [Diorhabda carinulata]XP_057664510.1 bumetanide-sensitive sodium-(potassium)-chloride cotransporter isoform X1 [Diorhabda carinulata]XP_057664512.1 bumetanide-sensitive sodium-(potassium)-chloride cotransporter isoform X1 [Diorhabda carinulata]XP_057664513.1 bumetanide-sensitive sodium-(potassium)-chloride cotransporter isoform X1 [Diorhabda carinulata]